MKIGDEVFVHGYVDEIRKDVIIIRNNGGYFGTIEGEIVIADTPQTETKGVGYCNECKWFRNKQVCGRCRSKNLFAEADTPQTELTAKCLNCRNAKACKENHWDGCIYEPQTDCEDIYPLVIIKDRYTGTYSNGEYTAWNMFFEDIPREIDEDDVTCYNFWHSYNGIVGLGETPNEAIEDLHKKLNVERNG